jgi:hypothetical protein
MALTSDASASSHPTSKDSIHPLARLCEGAIFQTKCSMSKTGLVILGLGKSSRRVNAVSGLYSPGPTLVEVRVGVFFMPASLPQNPDFGTSTSVGVLQCPVFSQFDLGNTLALFFHLESSKQNGA